METSQIRLSPYDLRYHDPRPLTSSVRHHYVIGRITTSHIPHPRFKPTANRGADFDCGLPQQLTRDDGMVDGPKL